MNPGPYYEARTPRQAAELEAWTGVRFELGDRMPRGLVEHLRAARRAMGLA